MKAVLKNILRSPYTVLLLAVLAANWQLVFLQRGMEWDMMNFWMPWRYYMSECYTNGIVPMWDPYTQSGYPVHGDLQGPAYSPEALLVSFLFGQNIYILNYCFVFYLFVASVGMFKLAHLFTRKKEVSVLAGIIYALSGFNIAHGHYFYIVVSVALIPFIFYYFFKLLDVGTYSDVIKFSLIIFWHITTGNPSFLIVSGYLMAFVFLAFVIWKIRDRQVHDILASLKMLSMVLGLSLLMALPVIYNALQIIPLTTRKDGLDLAYAGDESFYYQNFIAFVVPLITITNVDLTGYEQELWSPYVGAFTIFFFLCGIFSRKDFYERALIFVGLAGLVIALGLQWPVYPFLHKYLPMFNVFRMPNLSLLFFLMLVILVAAKFMAKEENAQMLFSRKITWYFAGLWFLLIVFMHFTAVKTGGEDPSLFSNYENLRQWLYDADPAKITLFHLLLFGITIVVLLVTTLSLKNKLRVLLITCFFDVFINYQLGGVARIFSVERAKDMNEYFSHFPKGIPDPSNVAMERVSGISTGWPGYWLNTSVFLKQPDFPNSNNFELINYLDLLLKKPRLSKNIFKNSYAFFADSLCAEEGFADSLLRSDRSVITMHSANLDKFGAKVFSNISNTYSCKRWHPNGYSFDVKNVAPTVFVVNQNYCPLWNFKVNGRAYKPFYSCSSSFPAFVLPAGNWNIEADYKLAGFGAVLFFSLALFVLLLLVLVYLSPVTKKTKAACISCILILFGYCGLKFATADLDSRNERVVEELASCVKGTVINNTSFDIPGVALKTDLVRNEDIARMADLLDTMRQNELVVLNYDRYCSPETGKLIELAYGKRSGTVKFIGATCARYTRHQTPKIILDTLNSAEATVSKRNEFGLGLVVDSVRASAFKAGDLILLTSNLDASCFDFPGLALELHFKDRSKAPLYRYANVSTIKGQGNTRAALVYELPEGSGELLKIVVSVWNPSACEARVGRLKLRVYRP